MDTRTARRLLLQERARLLGIQQAGRIPGTAGPVPVLQAAEVDERGADAGTETFDREMQESVADFAAAALAEVEAALDRLERHAYGRCETCDQPIDDERLRALPATRHCIQHAGA
jgi:DnaK suppressor protein